MWSITFPFSQQSLVLQKLLLTQQNPLPQHLELSSRVFLKWSQAPGVGAETPAESAEWAHSWLSNCRWLESGPQLTWLVLLAAPPAQLQKKTKVRQFASENSSHSILQFNRTVIVFRSLSPFLLLLTVFFPRYYHIYQYFQRKIHFAFQKQSAYLIWGHVVYKKIWHAVTFYDYLGLIQLEKLIFRKEDTKQSYRHVLPSLCKYKTIKVFSVSKYGENSFLNMVFFKIVNVINYKILPKQKNIDELK